MFKREAELKVAAMQELKRQCPHFLVLLQATAGAPDRLIVGGTCTTGWEFKHGTPDFLTQGNQTLMAMRLDANGCRTRYVIWQEGHDRTGLRTMIVRPREIHERTSWRVNPEEWCVGFDHKWLVAQIREAHGC